MTAIISLRRAARLLLDLALPARCLKCGEVLGGGEEGLCPSCWATLRWLGEPCCACCGLPFEFEAGEEARCGQCITEPPAFETARAAIAYDSESRDLVLRFKHADRTDAAPFLAAMMARAGARLLSRADLMAPVPLHWRRLFARRYNQSALLARELARLGAKPWLPQALRRRRATPSQGHLGKAARARNVAGAFVVPPVSKAKIAGRRVLLIDDVLTTGATVEACAATLVRAGAGAVDVLTLARVLQGQSAKESKHLELP
jgi:ComF family protein